MNKDKCIDPIPDEFSTYEEAAEFWDNHDTTDYLDILSPVKVKTKFKTRYYEIDIEPDIALMLQTQANQKGKTISHLVNDLLRSQLPIVQ